MTTIVACIMALLEEQAQAGNQMTYADAKAQCERQWRHADRRLRHHIAVADGQAAWHRRILHERYYDDADLAVTRARSSAPREAPPSAPLDTPATGAAEPREAPNAASVSPGARPAVGVSRAHLAWLEACTAALRGSGVTAVEARQLCDDAGRGSLEALRRIQFLTGHGPWVNGHDYPAPAPTSPGQEAPARPAAPPGSAGHADSRTNE